MHAIELQERLIAGANDAAQADQPMLAVMRLELAYTLAEFMGWGKRANLIYLAIKEVRRATNLPEA